MTHSTLTSKGQTTLPVQVRQALQLKPGDKILYEIQGDAVILRPHPGSMAVFGALKPPAGKSAVPFKKAREGAREAWIKEAAREGHR